MGSLIDQSELASLIEFFDERTLPDTPIVLGRGETITDCQKFVRSHLSISKQNQPWSYPYFIRLQRLKQLLENG